MAEENSPNNGPKDRRIQTLEARKKDLLLRKSLVKDSSVSRHIDWLLLEVDDLITKYDQSGKSNKEDQGPGVGNASNS